MKKVLLSMVVIAGLAIGTTSCGKTKEAAKDSVEATKEAVKTTGDAVKNAANTAKDAVATGVVKVVIDRNDARKFNLSEIKVKAGQKVTLTLNHTGKMAKNVMGHNFLLLEKGVDVSKFATKAMAAKANDYIPAEGVIAHTALIGGGETTTVTFVAPAKGTYDFICSFPGHYGIMKGKFIVE